MSGGRKAGEFERVPAERTCGTSARSSVLFRLPLMIERFLSDSTMYDSLSASISSYPGMLDGAVLNVVSISRSIDMICNKDSTLVAISTVFPTVDCQIRSSVKLERFDCE